MADAFFDEVRRMRRPAAALVLIALLCSSATASWSAEETPSPPDSRLVILSALAANGIDARYQPVDVMEKFPAGTNKVYCWLEWRGAEKSGRILARWIYEKNGLTIFEFPVPLPIRSGSGGVALAMPGKRAFPAGLYRVDLLGDDEAVLNSVRFEVL